MASDAGHPPVPGPIVQPNFLHVEEAIADITFPISKRELIEQVGEATVMFSGRNRDLHTLIKDLHDDFFESEEEFRAALETEYGAIEAADDHAPGVLPTGPQSSWQTRVGPGDLAGKSGHGLETGLGEDR